MKKYKIQNRSAKNFHACVLSVIRVIVNFTLRGRGGRVTYDTDISTENMSDKHIWLELGEVTTVFLPFIIAFCRVVT
jgi:hypothetical protein